MVNLGFIICWGIPEACWPPFCTISRYGPTHGGLPLIPTLDILHLEAVWFFVLELAFVDVG